MHHILHVDWPGKAREQDPPTSNFLTGENLWLASVDGSSWS